MSTTAVRSLSITVSRESWLHPTASHEGSKCYKSFSYPWGFQLTLEIEMHCVECHADIEDLHNVVMPVGIQII